MKFIEALNPVNSRGQMKRWVADLLDLSQAILAAHGDDFRDWRTLSDVDLVDELCGHWIKATERWKEREVTLGDPELAFKFWGAVRRSPFYPRFMPRVRKHRYTLVLGGTLAPSARKYADLLMLEQSGIELGDLAILASADRKLDPTMDNIHMLDRAQPGGPAPKAGWKRPRRWLASQRESDMMRALWDSSMPDHLTPTWVSATKNQGHRANTGNTVLAWLSLRQPMPGRVLVMSAAPHLFQYWDAVYLLAEAGFTIDFSMGPGDFIKPRPDMYLGGLARFLRSYYRATGVYKHEF